jgi:hypothetical protein
MDLSGNDESRCAQIFSECAMKANEDTSTHQAATSGTQINGWKRRNLADALLSEFELSNALPAAVIGKSNQILTFARDLLPKQLDPSTPRQAAIRKFDDGILENLEILATPPENLGVLGDDYYGKIDAAIESIQKGSDMFRSNDSLLFCLGLLLAAHKNEEDALQEFLNQWRNEQSAVQNPPEPTTSVTTTVTSVVTQTEEDGEKEELQEKIGEMEREKEKNGAALERLGKNIDSLKPDFSNAKIEDAYKMKKKSRVEDNAEFLKKAKFTNVDQKNNSIKDGNDSSSRNESSQ